MSYITVNGIELYYQTIGDFDSKKNTFIFLHGGAGIADHTIYIPFWSQFSDQVNVIFIDQRGCGLSEKGNSRDWNLTQHGQDLFQFCEALNIHHPIVGGVSWGGYVALSYATQYPDHPGALILCNTECQVSPEERHKAFMRIGGKDAADAVNAFDRQWSTTTNKKYFESCLPFYARNAYRPEELGGCIQNLDMWAQYNMTEHRYFNFSEQLYTINCPVLYLAGENDPVHPVASAIYTAEKIGDNCKLHVMPNTGDPVYRDTPKEAADIVSSFFLDLNLEAARRIQSRP